MSPDVEPPSDSFEWFWHVKECRGCGAVWEVIFAVDEIARRGTALPRLEPYVAHWRRAR